MSLSSSQESLSSVNSKEVGNILGVDLEDLFQERHVDIKEVLKDVEKAPVPVRDAAFTALSRSLRTHRYPTDSGMMEITRSAIFHPLLEIITDQLMKDLELSSFRDIEIQGDGKKHLSGRIAYVLKETDEPEQDEGSMKTTVSAGGKVMLYVECKRKKAVDGFKQSLLYVDETRKKNPDREVSRTFKIFFSKFFFSKMFLIWIRLNLFSH